MKKMLFGGCISSFFLAIFLGDGKQPIVDVFLSVCIGVLFIFALKRHSIRPLPRPITIAWIIFLGYAFIHVWISDSVGYSISWMTRAILGYLVFVFFYSFASKESLRLFTTSLVYLGVAGIGISLFLLGFPIFVKGMPLMNLLYPVYGHNHLADLLLFGFPIVLLRTKKHFWSIAVLVWYLFGFVVTFARGAWVLVAGLLLWWILTKATINRRVRGLGIAIAIIFLVSTLALSVVPLALRTSFSKVSDNPLVKLLIKSPLPTEGRFAYWRQALVAITERPWFGSGPGTFALQSKRLQKQVDSYSWFAHSFPLQIVVELGIVGALPLFVLLFLIARQIGMNLSARQESIEYEALAIAAGLTLVYSFYEFNLDYAVVWLVFWATLGMLVGMRNIENRSAGQLQNYILRGFLFYLGLYYVTYVASLTVFLWKPAGAVVIAPYRADTVKSEDAFTISAIALPGLRYLYQRDPDVLFALGQGLIHNGRSSEALTYYHDASLYDPYNEKYFGHYMLSLVSNGKLNTIGRLMQLWSQIYAPDQVQAAAVHLDFSAPELTQGYKNIFSDGVFQRPQKAEDLSKLYYMLGLSLVESNPQQAKQLWTLARDISVQWGYYHVELASLLLYKFVDESVAKKTLVDCQQYQDPRELCTITLQYWNEVPKPGTYEQQIRKIPKTDE